MRVDLRVKHDIEARKAAIGLFERGHGSESAAKALSVPRDTVRQWLYVYRSFGSEVLLSMDGKQARYTYEQKVAAASAVVDGGMSKRDAMEAFGVMSLAPLKRWCALYREGGAEALRPRPKGRPSGSKARPRTREEELEERCRRLETEVAYLKIACPGREGRALTRAKVEAVRVLREEGTGWGACWSAPAWPGPATTTRCRTRRLLPGPSSGRPPPRYSRARPTGAATGRSPCACAPSGARA